MRKIILLLLVIATLFVSSGQSYEQQSLIPTLEKWLPSKPMEEPLSKLEIPYWGKTISVEERGYYYFVEFLMRKSAHFFIFGTLAAVIFFILPARRNRMLLALLITLAFACADEYHQSLTGGRTASVKDVLLDMSGALTFLLFLQLLPNKKKRKKPIKSKK